ncbi:MAG: hypothetical protein ABR906_02795 [Terracidiphilus sp.]
MIDNSQSRLLQAQIRSVLLNTWDPIGIKDESNAQDEYDCCIDSIYDLLVRGAADSGLLDYLHWAVNEHIGLDAPREDMQETVDALRKIDFPAPNP